MREESVKGVDLKGGKWNLRRGIPIRSVEKFSRIDMSKCEEI